MRHPENDRPTRIFRPNAIDNLCNLVRRREQLSAFLFSETIFARTCRLLLGRNLTRRMWSARGFRNGAVQTAKQECACRDEPTTPIGGLWSPGCPRAFSEDCSVAMI